MFYVVHDMARESKLLILQYNSIINNFPDLRVDPVVHAGNY